ncbi:amidohydrolase [Streptomyces sp. NRRL F-4489]|uniref:creatininase family protein n=1 Tax=Streptomyces sp. NRRL F-4489 TaxID=1609095 RepID=UPI000746406E|nr:creatininase family protein [Streptomyces sp. NRRL F-4489]KUL36302.1 amidohydrolase [Streptomyces sp. NRRL F-4489]
MTPRPAARRLCDLSSAEVLAATAGRTVVWPVGSIEQHGPHLPLSVDTLLADAFARHIARELDALTLPAQPIAARSLPQSGGGLAFPGTVHVRGRSLLAFLEDTLESLCALPWRRLLIVNGHYENEPFLFEALDEVGRRPVAAGKEFIALSWWSLVDPDWLAARVPLFPGWHAEHAGLTETSLMLHLHPDLVADARPDHPDPPRPGIHLHPADVRRTTNQGVLSNTSGATAALGRDLFRHVVAAAVALVTEGAGLLREETP